MAENNIKIISYLDAEIEYLNEAIKKSEKQNEIIKLNIQKKELLLQKLELENN